MQVKGQDTRSLLTATATAMPIDITLDAFNASAMKTMRAFIHSKGKHVFRLSDPVSSLAVIVDFDHPMSRQAIDNARKRRQAVIALSRAEPQRESTEDVIWVNKPATALTMIAAGEKLHRKFSDAKAQQPANQDNTVTGNNTPPEAEWQKLSPKSQWEKRPSAEFSVDQNPNFDQHQTLLGYLLRAVEKSHTSGTAMAIHSEKREIIVCPKTNKVLFTFSFNVLKALCRFELNRKNTRIATARMPAKPDNPRHILLDLDKALWEIALMCSRGRMPEDCNADKVFQLNRWPNFTRWHIAPHAMRISSVWMQSPASANDIAKQLNIEPYFVYSYLTAAIATQIATPVENHKPALKPAAAPMAETRKLLHGLMRKLVGG